MDYRDKPPSSERGSRFNRRNRAKWVRIQPALTVRQGAWTAVPPGFIRFRPSGRRLKVYNVENARRDGRPAQDILVYLGSIDTAVMADDDAGLSLRTRLTFWEKAKRKLKAVDLMQEVRSEARCSLCALIRFSACPLHRMPEFNLR